MTLPPDILANAIEALEPFAKAFERGAPPSAWPLADDLRRAHAALASLRSLASAPADQSDAGRDGVARLPTKRCDECDNGVEGDWAFCPWCGLCQACGGSRTERFVNYGNNEDTRPCTVCAVLKSAGPAEAVGRDAVIEQAASIVRGEVYKERYRHWPGLAVDFGNRAIDSDFVRFADKAADAIRALKSAPSEVASLPAAVART